MPTLTANNQPTPLSLHTKPRAITVQGFHAFWPLQWQLNALAQYLLLAKSIQRPAPVDMQEVMPPSEGISGDQMP